MRTLVLLPAALILLSCESRPDGVEGTHTPAGGSVCSRPAEGCPCEGGSQPIECFELPTVSEDGGLVCHHGVRECRAGAWGACEVTESYALESDGTGALVTGPTDCNPCNPDCYEHSDNPTDADIPGHGVGVVYDPALGGITLTTMGGGGGSLPDGDGDGVPDVADDFPADPTRTGVEGGFYHTLPFGGPGVVDPFSFDAVVTTADVYFVVDTTGSMGGELSQIQIDLTTGTYDASCPDGIGGGIIGAIRCIVPNAYFGVGHFDDYPVDPYGSNSFGCTDEVYQNHQDITSSPASAQAAVNALTISCGNDGPESQSQTAWAIATGGGLGPYLSARSGCPAGRWGYPCFRSGTIPIIVMVTDASFHNGPDVTLDYDAGILSGGGGSVMLPPPTAVGGNEDQATAYFTGDASTTWTGYSGDTCAMLNHYDVGCNGLSSGDGVFQFNVTAPGTVRLTTETSFYDTVLSLRDSAFTEIACNDDAIGVQSVISAVLAPGTYYAVVDGYWGSCGSYQFSIGTPPVMMGGGGGGGYPVTWAETIAALNATSTKFICIESSGGWGSALADCQALANATGSVDSMGSPYVFTISDSGAGISSVIVDAVRDLANNTRFDITAQAVDNAATAAVDERDFVDAITAVSFPPGRCASSTPSAFIDCLPGTMVNFSVTFRNDVVMPTAAPQVFDFTIEVMMDGTVQDVIPVRIVVPPSLPMYPPSGTYTNDYDATAACMIPPTRPDWGAMDYRTTVPAGTSVVFRLQTADTLAGLGAATAVSVSVPPRPEIGSFNIGDELTAGGQANNRPYLRVTAVLNSDASRTIAPTLHGWDLNYTCVPSE